MAYSAFKLTAGKRYESTPGSCMSGSQITYSSPITDTTRISDIMDLHYEGGLCPNVGDIVRYSPITEALTLADAEYESMSGGDPEQSSEVVGVVESVEPNCDQSSGDKSRGTVVFFGKIDFGGNMPNGKKLTPGKVYYLIDTSEEETYSDPYARHLYRNGSTTEPKQVSKPVYIATTESTAVVTNFRGLMGGQPDHVTDEILATSICTDYGFLVSVINTGSRPWKTPISSILTQLNPLNGDPGSVATPSQSTWIQPNTYDSTTGVGIADSNFVTDEHQGVLQPAEEKQLLVGSPDIPYIGELTTTFSSNDIPRAATTVSCTPQLSIQSECGDGDEKSKFTISLTPSSQPMTSPLSFNILEKDSTGEYQILKVKGEIGQLTTEGSFQLPQTTGEQASYIYEVDIEDEYGSPLKGEYKIQFPEVVNSNHWAWDSLGSGAILSCTTSTCGCDGYPETHCLIFPHDEELRKTYGPTENGAYDLDGTNRRGETSDNPTAFPMLGNLDYDIVDGEFTEMPVWLGNTSRVNNDGSLGRMCGTIVGTPEELHMALTFTIPDTAAVCFPKHTVDKLEAGGKPWEVKIWKSRAMEESYALPIIQLGCGDAPEDPSKQLTILLGYDDVTDTFSDCFNIPLKDGTYYIDEELNG